MAKIFQRLVLVMLGISFGTAFARTPIETFIYHVKEGHNFTPVSNLWQPDNDFDRTSVLTELSKAQILRMDYGQLATFMKQQNFAVDLTIPGINGGSYTIELAKYDFRSDGFTVHIDGGNGQGRDMHELPGLYYRGVVKDIPGSIAAFSFFDDEVYGLFSIPGVGNFIIGSNSQGGDVHYILYNSADFLHPEKGPKCGADELPGANSQILNMARTTSRVGEKLYNSCKQVKVFEQADYNTYQGKVTVANTVKYMSSLFNCQSLIYKNEGILISLKYLQIDTVSDVYKTLTSTNSADWLDLFGSQTKNNLHGANIAILISSVKSYMGGIAWISSLCQGYNSVNNYGPYAFCDVDGYVYPASPTFAPTLNYYWDVNVTTHEMGHSLGSPHTHGCYWNGNNTAIDGCYTIEGSCGIPTPQYPAAGGTIMSYCHLVGSVGVNFSNGFGPQPGALIRQSVFSANCDTPYYIPSMAVNLPNKSFTANSECTDPNGITYYWNDSNTASQADDRLLLMVKKSGNNIGSIDSSGFNITVSTLPAFGTGTAQATSFPAGTAYIHTNTIALNHYWNMTATKIPVSAVEVMFPFNGKDTLDMNGTIHTSLNPSNYYMYTTEGAIDPNPAHNFPGATSSTINTYAYSTAPSTSSWSFTTLGNMNVAHVKMTNLTCGGGMYYTYWPTSLLNVNSTTNISLYPNPVHDQLFVDISNGQNNTMDIYTADGKLVQTQTLKEGSNIISVSALSTGIYLYRVVTSSNVYTGKIQKQ